MISALNIVIGKANIFNRNSRHPICDCPNVFIMEKISGNSVIPIRFHVR